VRSPHFTVLTDADEGSGRRVAGEFELIRAVFQQAFGHSLVDPAEPIFIYALEQEIGMAELLPRIWGDETRAKPVGLFRRGPDRHYVALLLDSGGARPYSTIYHEYFHLLLTVNLGDIPLWLNEGLASFWSTTEIWANDVRIGGADRDHVELLRREPMLPLPVLFAVNHDSPHYKDADKALVFYAQSWAFVHYLLVGNSLGKQKLSHYLTLLRENRDPETAWSEAFSNISVLEKLLKEYVRDCEFRGFSQGRPPSISDDALEARILKPAEVLALKAAFLTHGGAPEFARPLIDQSLALDPTLSVGHEVEAYYFLAEQEPEEALRSLERAIELHSDSFLAHYHCAVLVLQTRSPIDKAFAGLAAAISLNADFVRAHLLLAELASDWRRELDAGLASAKRAIELAPRAPDARRALAVVRTARGELAEAAQAYRNAIALDPGSPVLQAELGAALAEAGRAEEAVAAFRQALELAPGSAALYFPLAVQLLELERFEEAADAFEVVRATVPEDAELYHAMASAFAGAGRLEQALAAFRTAEALDPYDAEIASDHASALEQAGQRNEAIDAYRRAIALEPDVASYHHRLAVVLERSGRTEDAKKHFEEATRLGYRP
jgi:tetratricopeptide (TPR) repeat protein